MGIVKFGDPAPDAQPFRMIVEMAAVPTIYGQDQEFVPGRAQAYADVTMVRPDGSVQYWRTPAEGLQPVTLKAASPKR